MHKTGEERLGSLEPQTMTLIEELRKSLGKNSEDFIFPGLTGK
jgi:hypothetical protein